MCQDISTVLYISFRAPARSFSLIVSMLVGAGCSESNKATVVQENSENFILGLFSVVFVKFSFSLEKVIKKWVYFMSLNV